MTDCPLNMPRSKGFSLCLSEKLINWALARSLSAFPVESGCCAQSFFAGGRYSVHETGMESVLNPRHADVLVLTGALSNKIVPVLRMIYDQMPEQKFVMALGACACNGGIFYKNYAVLSDVSSIFPVDVYVPGCPPSLQAFQKGVLLLREKIENRVARTAK